MNSAGRFNSYIFGESSKYKASQEQFSSVGDSCLYIYVKGNEGVQWMSPSVVFVVFSLFFFGEDEFKPNFQN